MKLNVEKNGMFISAENEKIALVGGFRSGNSDSNTTRLKFIIINIEAYEKAIKENKNKLEAEEISNSGEVELFVENGTDFNVKGLVNIEIRNLKEHRRKGIATEVIKSITDTIDGDLPIFDIQNNKSAIGFWQAVGVEFTNGNGRKINNFIDGNIAGTVIKEKIDKIYDIRNKKDNEFEYSM